MNMVAHDKNKKSTKGEGNPSDINAFGYKF